MRNVFPGERSDVPTASRDAFDIYSLFSLERYNLINPSREAAQKGPSLSTGCFERRYLYLRAIIFSFICASRSREKLIAPIEVRY